jgi:saccharopine dehydrogenase-like NADP-dependent oxidoreductase
MKIIVIGAGLVGRAMALDLAAESRFRVTCVDIDSKKLAALPEPVQTIQADVSKKNTLQQMLKEQDLVVSAVPGWMGFRTLETIIRAGKNVVDIAFFPEDMKHLHELARQKQVTAVCDAGVAPGMSNLLAAKAAKSLKEVDKILIYVGGLPKIRREPFEYKAPFSPADVVEEYTRPARLIENYKIISKPPLSEYEKIDFDTVGTLEAFNTDGLRSLLQAIPCGEMKEKTLRYPGYAEKIQFLKDIGLLSKQPILINGQQVKPVEMAEKLLFPLWKLTPDEEEFTVMRVIVEGVTSEGKKRITWDLYDTFDVKTGIHSMARTTGYTATAIARLVAEKRFTEKGVFAPEKLVESSDWFQFVISDLQSHNVTYSKREENFG